MTRASQTHSSADFSAILKRQETFGSGLGEDVADLINSWYDRLLLQTGWQLSPGVVVLLNILGAVALGGGLFVWREDFLLTAVGSVLGFFLPTLIALVARNRRQRTILRQLPAMLEELARAAKTGRSIEQCLLMVAEDTPAPLGEEIRLAARRLALGIPLREALRDWTLRTGVNTLGLLATTLVVHQQTGGDLVVVLNRLSQTVRDRIMFLGRLQAATAASRATALLMIVLPPAVLVFFTLRDPNYLGRLLASTGGRAATLLALMLEVIGIVWVLRILRNTQRS
ncbi:MAG: hypothetical protein KatS3mg113_0193 [Planctomycetaceae bacterium]|nr:MAG: hypothetical protein KatS3mg113_0193 [Planctomycetaceae bacterium]